MDNVYIVNSTSVIYIYIYYRKLTKCNDIGFKKTKGMISLMILVETAKAKSLATGN